MLRIFSICFSLLIFFSVSQFAATAENRAGNLSAGKRPNVVVILTDDQGWGDLSLNGNQNLSTPNIDALAKAGAHFDRFYVCPVCSPTRAEFLTGRYHVRGGVYSTSAGGERLDLDEQTIADVFQAAGYKTGAFGKWHNGMQYPYHPCGRGFDEFYGFCSGHWGDYFSPPLDHNGKIVEGRGFCVDDFTDRALEFMESAIEEEKPFFAYLPYNTPHSPMQVPDRFWEKFKDHPLPMRHREPNKENIQHTRAALAMCENIDWNVGRINDKLHEWGIADTTIVVYFCDNGPNGSRFNGGMKGRKGSTDEGGVRSPLIVRWPDSIRPGTRIDEIGAAIDLLPTLAEMCDVSLASPQPLDGKSLAPALTGGELPWEDRQIISFWRGRVSVRNQRFRLGDKGGLYDIAADPGQRTNVAADNPEVVAALNETKQHFLKDIAAGYDHDERPFLIGHKTFKYTQLPARDATGSGGIKRSNKYPNCSYLYNWTKESEQIKFEGLVAASGRYSVDLYYGVPAADVGATIELRIGKSTLRATISKAAELPERGGENDRVRRMESYVKDFLSITLGEIELTAGQEGATLSALDIPGNQVIEFRALQLTRVD
ncbi:MAG TPA: N-acetylgalactosamine 6-sulfate sulfatase [Planctomycetaceae bacterium]|nr:N-acetylgalactosamine 6-sulfate sulfatase [Planctomycetaceae bacterium]